MHVPSSTSFRGYLESHLGSQHVTRVVYGSVIGLALVVALEKHPPSATQTAGALIGTAIAVGLADLYSDIVGTEARTRARVGAHHVREMIGAAGAVVLGAAFPALFFIASAVGLLELDQAFTWSKWTGLALLGTYGYLAAKLSGSSTLAALGHAALVGAIGGLLIGLKALLH